MKKLVMVFTVSLSLALAASAGFAADGKTLYAKCAGCHGADGAKTAQGNKPLKGLSADAFTKAMEGYKAKKFGGPKKAVMEGLAASLSPADIQALAAYVSKL
ncbi:c-type cytochrome [Humidesulfovibrio idahonensis]